MVGKHELAASRIQKYVFYYFSYTIMESEDNKLFGGPFILV